MIVMDFKSTVITSIFLWLTSSPILCTKNSYIDEVYDTKLFESKTNENNYNKYVYPKDERNIYYKILLK
jgi:hypothetical protein